jgi:hypothetical protein
VLPLRYERTARVSEIATGGRNGTGHLLVVFLRVFDHATFLQRDAQGQGIQAGQGGHHGEEAGGLVHVQAHGLAAILRRLARQTGLSWKDAVFSVEFSFCLPRG